MAVTESRDIISVLLAIFGIFLIYSAATNFQQLRIVDFTVIAYFLGGLISFGIAYRMSGKR